MTGTSSVRGGREAQPEPFAVSGVITLLFLASVYVWTSVLSPQGRVAAVASIGVEDHCASGWVVPDEGDTPIPMAGRPSGSVLGSGGAVTVTVRGTSGDAIVLHPPVVEVLGRRPALPGVFLPAPCDVGRSSGFLTVDLDRPTALLGPDGEPAEFPYQVTGTAPEKIVIRPVSTTDDVEWRLRIPWTSGVGGGELVVDDDGNPLRTTATSAARPFCVELPDSARWVSCGIG